MPRLQALLPFLKLINNSRRGASTSVLSLASVRHFPNNWCAIYQVACMDRLLQWAGKQNLCPTPPACSTHQPRVLGLTVSPACEGWGKGAVQLATFIIQQPVRQAGEWRHYRDLEEKTVLVRSSGFHNEISCAFRKSFKMMVKLEDTYTVFL